MAQLNMMGNQWNMGHHQAWPTNSFNGSNMSLNMMPQSFLQNDQAMWNPLWMQQQQQQQQFPFPMMPNGKSFENAIVKLHS